MKSIPYNGFLEIWLQRIVIPKEINILFESDEGICKIVNGKITELWNNNWIASKDLKQVIDPSKIVNEVSEVKKLITPDEISLFTQIAAEY